MQLDQILNLIKDPSKILAIQDQESVIDWTTFFIYELENELADMDFVLDQKLAKLTELHGSVAKGEVNLRLTEEWRERKKKELTLKALKSYRQNIRRKRDRIIH